MEKKAERTAENCCVSCGSPIPPGTVTCSKCSLVKTARRRPVKRGSEGSCGYVSVLRTPEENVRRSVAHGTLAKEQGELLILLLSRSHLLDPSVRSVPTSLINEIAEERNAQKREDRVYVLMEFVAITMPSDDFASDLFRVFKTGES